MQNLVSGEELLLHMFVVDAETSEETLLGEKVIKLCEFYLENNKMPFWQQLHAPASDLEEFGEVLVSLSYLPTSERLKVIVVEAKRLRFHNDELSGGLY